MQKCSVKLNEINSRIKKTLAFYFGQEYSSLMENEMIHTTKDMENASYIAPTKVDSSSVSSLLGARDLQRQIWKQVLTIRTAIANEPLGGNRAHLRLQLLYARSAHSDAKATESQCLKIIEARANELGLTTIKSGKEK